MLGSRRRMLAVMFTDIVGYSALVNRDEQRALGLLEMHRQLLRRELDAYGGEIVDTIGDGNLATFPSAQAAVECAVAVQAELARRNVAGDPAWPLRLRIGLHAGDVERRRGRAFGDGVNVAARVEPLAPPGGIGATAVVVAQLHGPLRACFASIGARSLKNIPEPQELHALPEGEVLRAATLLAPPRRWRGRLRRARPWLGVAATIVLGAGVVLALARFGAPRADDASVAVLPLQNLSPEPGHDEFVAGLHDSLLTEVSTMPQLKVISRTSVMRYAKAPPPMPEIGRQLGVAYVLEGSVQRAAGRVRINVQLIQARSDRHVWAHTYDRESGDVFDMQAQIAREIARNLQGRVMIDALPAAKRPTDSAEAYELYLRAIALEDNDPKLGREAPAEQLALLEQAVALDPSFSLAHAALARYNLWAANWASYVEPARHASYVGAAARAAARAMELAPRQPESLVSAGLAAYWQHKPLDQVARQLEDALAVRPGYSLARFWLGNVYSRMGQAEKSAAALLALNAIDPYNERAYTELVAQQLNLRRYDDLADTFARWRSVSESPAFVDFWASQLPFYRTGDLGPWREYLERPAGKGVTAGDLDNARWEVALYEHRFADAAAIARAQADAFVGGATADYTGALWTGLALAEGGDPRQAGPYLEASVRYFNEALRADPRSSTALSLLGLADIVSGRGEDALRHTRAAVELTTPTHGGRPGPGHYESTLYHAQALARFGHKSEALERLEWLLQQPSGLHAHAVLRDPLWRPLDQDAEFRALVARYLPSV